MPDKKTQNMLYRKRNLKFDLITLFGTRVTDAEDDFVADVEEGAAVVGDGQEHVHVLRHGEHVVHCGGKKLGYN